MWSSWYQSEPGPSTVENRAHTECSTLSRNSRGTVRSVSEIDRPSASLKERTSSALARPCSDKAAPTMRLRPRHSNESKLSRSVMTLPRLLGQRRHVGADPVGDRRRHGAAEDRRRLDRDPTLVGQHHGLQPHQVFSTAAAGDHGCRECWARSQSLRSAPAGKPRAEARRSRLGRLVASAGVCLPAGFGWAAGASAGRGFGKGMDTLSTARRCLGRYPRTGCSTVLSGPARRGAESGCPQSTAAARPAVTIAASPPRPAATRPFAARIPRAKLLAIP